MGNRMSLEINNNEWFYKLLNNFILSPCDTIVENFTK